MTDINPRNSDLVLGRQYSPPVAAAVLGGLAGVKQRLERESIAERLQALNNAVQYGDGGIDLLIKSLSDPSEKICRLACKLLFDRFGYEILYARLEEQDKHRLNIILAGHPECPHELLKKLSGYNDLQILKNLAGNPNTPLYILFKLGDVKNFNFISKMNIEDFEKWNQLAKIDPFCTNKGAEINRSPIHEHNINLEKHYEWLIDSGIPDKIVEIVRVICEIYQNVARNQNAPIDTVECLAGLFQSDVIENPARPIFSRFYLLTEQQIYRQIARAKDINVSMAGLVYLTSICDISVYKYIIVHPNISIETLEAIFEDIEDGPRQHPLHRPDPIHRNETWVAIAKNPKTPLHILEKLAVHIEEITDEKIKSELGLAIAEHPNNLK